MKRCAFVLALLALLIVMAPAALGYSYSDNFPEYVVESFEPNGYCYLYDQPSSLDHVSRNLGDHKNGEIVKVISYDNNGYYYVVCSNGKEGYIHAEVLTPYEETLNRERCMIYSTSPNGYCYLYDKPSSVNGRNLGRYENGEYVWIIDWYADENYSKVQCERTLKYGYINKQSLVQDNGNPQPTITARPTATPTPRPTFVPYQPPKETATPTPTRVPFYWRTPTPTPTPTRVPFYWRTPTPTPTRVPFYWRTPTSTPVAQPNPFSTTQYYAQVNSIYGYCYVYDRPTDYGSSNLGRHNNTEWVRVIDWDFDWNFAYVECLTDGTVGYIRKDCLTIK